MAKEETFTMRGTVVEVKPNAMFKIRIDESDTEVLGTISGKIRKNNIKILLGDAVDIEMSPYDVTRGRITYRYK